MVPKTAASAKVEQLKIYVLGAGASKASQGEGIAKNLRSAPLVGELFDEVYRKWVAYDSLTSYELQEMRKAISASTGLEAWLTQEWEKLPTYQQESSKFAKKAEFGRIAFYLWRLFTGVSQTYSESNGYREFARRLKDLDRDFGLISFNYDVLLDRSIQDEFGVSLDHLDKYFTQKFIKPHGSVNWLLSKRDSEPTLTTQEHGVDYGKRFRVATSLMFNGPSLPYGQLRVLRPDAANLYAGFEDLVHVFGREYFFPLILLPLTGKMYGFVDQLNDEIMKRSTTMLASASDVYLVGYRARDEIIHEMLKSIPSGARLHTVGRSSAHGIIKDVLDRNGHLVRGDVFDTGFLHFVKTNLR